MILIHENMSRGRTKKGWLDSYHTFSFGGFQDPTRMGFGPLRVINEDSIAPGSGFSEHGHDNMDILTVVLKGEIEHRDTMGNVSTIAPGEMQLMSAGTGLRHSEMNASESETAHLLQIWLIPEVLNRAPAYQHIRLPAPEETRAWTLIASGEAGKAPLTLLSGSRISIAHPKDGDRMGIPAVPNRLAFVHIVEGLARIGDETLRTGDGLQIANAEVPDIEWLTDGKALLFDMPR
ncbi:pirin family protein [Brucella sp. IR073]|uniref:pirin family protein n=1 Tax=unclassified Brucella TaxID=2632610 RepID=UPI003B986C6E